MILNVTEILVALCAVLTLGALLLGGLVTIAMRTGAILDTLRRIVPLVERHERESIARTAVAEALAPNGTGKHSAVSVSSTS